MDGIDKAEMFAGYTLAQSKIPRVLPYGAIVSGDSGRHVKRSYRVHWIHVGKHESSRNILFSVQSSSSEQSSRRVLGILLLGKWQIARNVIHAKILVSIEIP